MRVAAYYRVSTGRETQKQSLENQITFYTDHVRQNPYGNLIAVYEDNFSGLLIKRSAAIEILQKTENQENLDMCFIEDAHGAIIDKEFFEKCRLEKGILRYSAFYEKILLSVLQSEEIES